MTHLCKPGTQELRQEITNSRVARLQRETQLPREKGGWVGWGWENRAPAQLLLFTVWTQFQPFSSWKCGTLVLPRFPFLLWLISSPYLTPGLESIQTKAQTLFFQSSLSPQAPLRQNPFAN